MGAPETLELAHVVDTARYPLGAPGSTAWNTVVARARHDLRRFGCSVMPDFIRPSFGETLREESAQVAPLAYYNVEVVNAYNLAVDAPLAEDHPGRLLMRRGNAFVTRDLIPTGLVIHQLYTDPCFQHFIADCAGFPALHPLADPLAGLCLNVVRPGMEHPWHFDTNELAVSLLTQAPEAGGEFEYCPNIRTTRNENFEDVRQVLNGQRDDLVRRITLRPGDLQLFDGRFSLHRVTAVRGERARHSAIFAYSERPGVMGRLARTQQLFGRAGPEHLVAEGQAVRGDRLLD
jgi:hypothetical protein